VTGGSWALAALLCWHLSVSGAVPKEVPVEQVRPWALNQKHVRVIVLDGARNITIRSSSPAAIVNAENGARVASAGAGATITITSWGGALVLRVGGHRINLHAARIEPSSGGTVILPGARRLNAYPDSVEIAADGGRLRVINDVGLESYLAGVVAAEVPSTFPLEAMKAQAIAARTYTLSHLGDHAAKGADLCAQVHCQVYSGAPPATSRAALAVRQTAGEVLAWNDLLIDALYHSACGGATAAPWDVRQGKLLPYLTGGSDSEPGGDAYCDMDQDSHWTATFTCQQAERLVAANLGAVTARPGLSPGHLRSLQIESRRRSRVEWLDVVTSTGHYRVRGDAIRWLFGNGHPGPSGLRSSAFTLSVKKDRRGRPTAFVFKGVGHGHGIGMCQWGARGRAESGQTAAEILSAYYPGAEIVNLRHG
jgi:stage II sporulation protein D